MDSFLDSWVVHLFIMLLGYATVFIPGYLLIRYLKSIKYEENAGNSIISRLIISCVYGSDDWQLLDSNAGGTSPLKTTSSSSLRRALNLVFCVIGLQVSYLTWGILQEKIMTKEYIGLDLHETGSFKESQFLVFVNRILAFLLAGAYLLVSKQPRHTAPLYKYSYCSFSNIMSSWCQYEALKYVSFPTQVLAKASKIIPVMLMGKLVSGKSYEYYEYAVALLISTGMTLFLFGSTTDSGKTGTSTTLSGVIILVGYMAFDSFTSNWQGELFTTYKMSSVQMMCGVNLFSCLLTSVSLLQQGTFSVAFAFMVKFPVFLWDCIVLSVCSATGQLFIYYTIATFGPVVFIIIMTVRQLLAILLSCIIYSHPVSLLAGFGITFVFMAIFLRIYCSHRVKQLKKRRTAAQDAIRA
ncbi:adenosine 3'-phospho 5'-phosphosulfate transporter 1 [Hyalella azteca]|uniref:Adenosine 3'-phospho 5'-phosphosulfate transporter 1 n=1 Tax=Hyalella azteca TaxID=294128 RepID=A0A8B7P138_HYAAZ|nr:adenosine 3'-phospho 5'-phosphosulfate transporter 1 [Hyalella azteca]